MYVIIDWTHSADELRALYQAETDGKLRQRYHALWLLHEAHMTMDEIAALLAVHPSMIIRWANWYRAGGLDELQAHRLGRMGGITDLLTLEDCSLLSAYAETGQFRSIEEVRQWVENYFGVTYTYWGMRSVLDRCGLHGVMPRPIAPGADEDVQDARK